MEIFSSSEMKCVDVCVVVLEVLGGRGRYPTEGQKSQHMARGAKEAARVQSRARGASASVQALCGRATSTSSRRHVVITSLEASPI